jgi:FKBP-type peptidyl-prolyl cis-trans isomerase SlyD
MIIAENTVVSLHFTLTNDEGQTLDSSAGSEPLCYLHGGIGIIPGLEKELLGKAVGDKFVVVIRPEDAYGEIHSELISVMPRDTFQGAENIEPGTQLEATGPSGETQLITVKEIGDEGVTVDANHPLAGQVLHFDVSIEHIRDATPEEIAQGHPD